MRDQMMNCQISTMNPSTSTTTTQYYQLSNSNQPIYAYPTNQPNVYVMDPNQFNISQQPVISHVVYTQQPVQRRIIRRAMKPMMRSQPYFIPVNCPVDVPDIYRFFDPKMKQLPNLTADEVDNFFNADFPKLEQQNLTGNQEQTPRIITYNMSQRVPMTQQPRYQQENRPYIRHPITRMQNSQYFQSNGRIYYLKPATNIVKNEVFVDDSPPLLPLQTKN